MKQVVVLGAGYAGLKTVHELQKKADGSFKITLVNKNSYHYEATDLHEVAAGTEPKEKITYDVADISQTTAYLVERCSEADLDAFYRVLEEYLKLLKSVMQR